MTGGQLAFAKELQQKTGLNLGVILAWVTLENGPADNPLNVSPGGRVARYGTPYAAAQATYQVIRSQHAGILAARGKDPSGQINAIASSGWATDPAYHSKLVSVAKRIFAGSKGGGGGGFFGTLGHALEGAGKAVAAPGIAAGKGAFDLATGDFGGAAHEAGKVASAPLGLVGDVAGALGITGWVGGLVKGLLAIFVAVVILLLAAALFYNGVRRLSGDRIPSAADLARAGGARAIPVTAT